MQSQPSGAANTAGSGAPQTGRLSSRHTTPILSPQPQGVGGGSAHHQHHSHGAFNPFATSSAFPYFPPSSRGVAGAGDPDAEVTKQWSMVSTMTISSFLTVFTAFILYSCYTLVEPYISGILWGILFSVIFHPSTEHWLESAEKRKIRRGRCLERLMSGYERQEPRLQQLSWYRRYPTRVYLRLLTTWSFFRHYLFELGDFLGIDKLPLVLEERNARKAARYQRAISYGAITLFMVTLSNPVAVLYIQISAVLLICGLRLLFSAERFLDYAGRACDIIASTTIAIMLAVGFATDVRDVSNTVTSTTEMIIDNTGLDAHVVEDFIADLQERFLEDIAAGFNSSNVTKTAMDIKRTIEPLLTTNFTSVVADVNFTRLYHEIMVALDPSLAEAYGINLSNGSSSSSSSSSGGFSSNRGESAVFFNSYGGEGGRGEPRSFGGQQLCVVVTETDELAGTKTADGVVDSQQQQQQQGPFVFPVVDEEGNTVGQSSTTNPKNFFNESESDDAGTPATEQESGGLFASSYGFGGLAAFFTQEQQPAVAQRGPPVCSSDIQKRYEEKKQQQRRRLQLVKRSENSPFNTDNKNKKIEQNPPAALRTTRSDVDDEDVVNAEESTRSGSLPALSFSKKSEKRPQRLVMSLEKGEEDTPTKKEPPTAQKEKRGLKSEGHAIKGKGKDYEDDSENTNDEQEDEKDQQTRRFKRPRKSGSFTTEASSNTRDHHRQYSERDDADDFSTRVGDGGDSSGRDDEGGSPRSRRRRKRNRNKARQAQQHHQKGQGQQLQQQGSVGLMSAAQTLGARWAPFLKSFVELLSLFVSKIVNIFDAVYELMLFAFVYRFCTSTQFMPETMLYSVLAKVLVLQPNALYAYQRAYAIEEDIINQFLSLFQSFWHITWYHFAITYACFQACGFPLPFFMGLVSVALALFPLFSRYIAPCFIAFYVVVFLDIKNHEINIVRETILVLAMIGELKDEWLLSVARKREGSKRRHKHKQRSGGGGRAGERPSDDKKRKGIKSSSSTSTTTTTKDDAETARNQRRSSIVAGGEAAGGGKVEASASSSPLPPLATGRRRVGELLLSEGNIRNDGNDSFGGTLATTGRGSGGPPRAYGSGGGGGGGYSSSGGGGIYGGGYSSSGGGGHKHHTNTSNNLSGAPSLAPRREQLPTFIVGTSVVLGLVSYGLQGVVIGPLIFIIAKALYDNFGYDTEAPSNIDLHVLVGPDGTSIGLVPAAATLGSGGGTSSMYGGPPPAAVNLTPRQMMASSRATAAAGYQHGSNLSPSLRLSSAYGPQPQMISTVTQVAPTTSTATDEDSKSSPNAALTLPPTTARRVAFSQQPSQHGGPVPPHFDLHSEKNRDHNQPPEERGGDHDSATVMDAYTMNSALFLPSVHRAYASMPLPSARGPMTARGTLHKAVMMQNNFHQQLLLQQQQQQQYLNYAAHPHPPPHSSTPASVLQQQLEHAEQQHQLFYASKKSNNSTSPAQTSSLHVVAPRRSSRSPATRATASPSPQKPRRKDKGGESEAAAVEEGPRPSAAGALLFGCGGLLAGFVGGKGSEEEAAKKKKNRKSVSSTTSRECSHDDYDNDNGRGLSASYNSTGSLLGDHHDALEMDTETSSSPTSLAVAATNTAANHKNKNKMPALNLKSPDMPDPRFSAELYTIAPPQQKSETDEQRKTKGKAKYKSSPLLSSSSPSAPAAIHGNKKKVVEGSIAHEEGGKGGEGSVSSVEDNKSDRKERVGLGAEEDIHHENDDHHEEEEDSQNMEKQLSLLSLDANDEEHLQGYDDDDEDERNGAGAIAEDDEDEILRQSKARASLSSGRYFYDEEGGGTDRDRSSSSSCSLSSPTSPLPHVPPYSTVYSGAALRSARGANRLPPPPMIVGNDQRNYFYHQYQQPSHLAHVQYSHHPNYLYQEAVIGGGGPFVPNPTNPNSDPNSLRHVSGHPYSNSHIYPPAAADEERQQQQQLTHREAAYGNSGNRVCASSSTGSSSDGESSGSASSSSSTCDKNLQRRIRSEGSAKKKSGTSDGKLSWTEQTTETIVVSSPSGGSSSSPLTRDVAPLSLMPEPLQPSVVKKVNESDVNEKEKQDQLAVTRSSQRDDLKTDSAKNKACQPKQNNNNNNNNNNNKKQTQSKRKR